MEQKEKFNVKTYMGYITTVVVVVAYIIYGVIGPEKKDTTILDSLINSALILTLGVLVSNTLSQQGLLDGAKTLMYNQAKTQVNMAYSKVKPYSQYVNKYIDIKNKRAIREVIDSILDKYNLVYKDHYDDEGRFKQSSFFIEEDSDSEIIKKDKKKKNNALQKLSSGLRVTQITADDVFAQDNATIKDPLKRGRTEKTFIIQENNRLIASKIVTAVIGGAYGATFIGANAGTILFKILIAIMLVAMGFSSYLKHYKYKTVEGVGRLNQSALWMDEMYNMILSGEIAIIKREESHDAIADTVYKEEKGFDIKDIDNKEEVFKDQQEIFYKKDIVDENKISDNYNEIDVGDLTENN